MNKSIILRGLSILVCLALLVGCLPFVTMADEPLHTITLLNKLGGETITNSITNAEYTLPYCEFSPISGTKFGGWYVNGEVKEPGETIPLFSDITIPAVWKIIGDSLTIELKNHTYISDYPDLQLFGLEMLSDKGLILVDEEILGYRNQQGKLLFTFVEETAELILADDLTEGDNITYLLPDYEREALLNEFGIDIPDVKLIVCQEQPKEPEKEPILILHNGDNINHWTALEYNIFYTFDIKGQIHVEQVGEGFWITDASNRLLLTINSQGIITLGSTVSDSDNMEYILTPEEKVNDFAGVKKISLQFDLTVLGDVYKDGKVNAKDALEVLKACVGKIELTPQQQKNAEVVGDEKIDAKDALEILKFSVNKITKFPIETK